MSHLDMQDFNKSTLLRLICYKDSLGEGLSDQALGGIAIYTPRFKIGHKDKPLNFSEMHK